VGEAQAEVATAGAVVEAEGAAAPMDRQKASSLMPSGIATAHPDFPPSTSRSRKRARIKVVGSIPASRRNRSAAAFSCGTRRLSLVRRQLC